MNEPAYFGRYALLGRLDATIVAKTPLRIGRAKELEVLESDLPIIKNAQDIPIIPGSSLKGFFRANAERILMNMLKVEEAKDTTERIFGSSREGNHASTIFFNDMRASEYRLENRKHIRIDPETGGVFRGGLFEAECVMDGAVFEGLLATTRNLSPAYMGIVQPVIELASLGVSRLGGFKSRGYGLVDISISKLTLIIPGKSKDELRKPVVVQPTVGTRMPTYIEVENDERVKLTEVEEVTFSCKVQGAPNYIGTQLVVDDPAEVMKLLSSLVVQLQKSLAEGSK